MPCVQEGGGVGTSRYVHREAPFSMYFVVFSYARYFYHTLLSLEATFITVL